MMFVPSFLAHHACFRWRKYSLMWARLRSVAVSQSALTDMDYPFTNCSEYIDVNEVSNKRNPWLSG